MDCYYITEKITIYLTEIKSQNRILIQILFKSSLMVIDINNVNRNQINIYEDIP